MCYLPGFQVKTARQTHVRGARESSHGAGISGETVTSPAGPAWDFCGRARQPDSGSPAFLLPGPAPRSPRRASPAPPRGEPALDPGSRAQDWAPQRGAACEVSNISLSELALVKFLDEDLYREIRRKVVLRKFKVCLSTSLFEDLCSLVFQAGLF